MKDIFIIENVEKNKAWDEYEKAVKKAGVVEQSEQLVCDCVIPKPKDAYIVPDKYYCRECNGRIVN